MTLYQQVNLYPHKPKESQSGLTLRRALVVLGVVVLMTAAAAFALAWKGSGIQKELNAVEKKIGPLQAQVETLSASVGQRSVDPALISQVQQLQYLERLQAQVIGEVLMIKPGEQQGFSPVLQGLTEVQVKGVWLEQVRIDRADDHIRLVGRTLSPDRVPIYIEALHRSGIFSGVQFKAVRVEAVDEGQQPYRFQLSSHRGEEEQ